MRARAEQFAQLAGYPVQFVPGRSTRLPRRARTQSRPLRDSSADYIVLVDGDMLAASASSSPIMCALARRGISGARACASRWTTRPRSRVLRPAAQATAVLSPGLGFTRRAYAAARTRHRARVLQPRRQTRLIAVKACNQGFWRSDLLLVNGYDEDLTGWGSEDKELCARLRNGGVRRQTLIFAGIAWHLAHRPVSRAAARANRERWQETVRTRRLRCTHGIDQHPPG
jgi:hypothetical protein